MYIDDFIKLYGVNSTTYNLCKQYIDKYNNNMNVDFKKNGELLLIKYLSHLSKINVIFDIGANIGEYSKLWLKYNHKNQTIYAFEPIAQNIKELKINTANKINYIQAGVSDIDGKTSFFIADVKNYSHSSMYDMNTIGYPTKSTKVDIEILKIDTFMKKHAIKYIDFMKIDIEGNELKALNGAKEALSLGKIKFIQFEFGHASRANRVLFIDFINFFKSFDFDIYVIKPTHIEKVIYTPFFENIYDVANFIAFKKYYRKDLLDIII